MKINFKLYALLFLTILFVPFTVFAMSEGNCNKYNGYEWYGYSVVVKGEETLGTVSGNQNISNYFNAKFKSGEINAKDVSGIFLFFEDSEGKQYSSKAQTNWKGHIKCSGKVTLIQGAEHVHVDNEDEEETLNRISQYKCSDLESTELYTRVLNPTYKFIRYAVPALLVVLCAYDFVTAMIADNADKMKKAQKNAVTRIVIGLTIMFLPTLLNALLALVGNYSTCGVGM